MDIHNTTVSKLAEQVASFYSRSIPFRIYHGNTNSTRASTRTASNSLDISSLKSILSIDTTTKTCICEPNVSMEDLLSTTIKHNLMPPVVPELPSITVGGAFAGTAGESSCFKYSFFDRCITSLEMILANGSLVVANDVSHSDLFRGAAGTFGTLGVLTLLQIILIPCQPYVELTYHPVNSIQAAVTTIVNAMSSDRSGSQPIDFLDGIMFKPTHGCIMTGRFSCGPAAKMPSPVADVATFHKPSDQWFYLHAEAYSDVSRYSASTPHRDLIPLQSYIFRFDRGAFWTGKYAYQYFMMPFNRMTRLLLNPFMHGRAMYHGLHRSGLADEFVIQDMAVPASCMADFSDWLDSREGMCREVYPRWLCSLKAGEPVSMNPHNRNSSCSGELLLNIGLWGPLPSSSRRPHLRINRLIESKLASLGGMKWLYAQTYYTEEEFWSIYDREWYGDLRQKYRAENLPNVYQKVGPKPELLEGLRSGRQEHGFGWSACNVWPLRGLYGVASVVKGGDYLRKRR